MYLYETGEYMCMYLGANEIILLKLVIILTYTKYDERHSDEEWTGSVKYFKYQV